MAKLKKAKYVLMKVGLGVLVFVSTVGIVLGLSILFGALRKPIDEGETTSTQTTTTEYSLSSFVSTATLPYETETFKIEYISESDKVVVHMYPDLSAEGSIIDQQDAIKAEVREWINQNGGDAPAMESAGKLEWSMK